MSPRLTGCLVAAALVLAPGFAGMLADALVGPTPPTSTPAPAARGEAATPAQVWHEVHAAPTHAARSRSPRATGRASGHLTDVTCYVATGHPTASGLVPRVGMAANNRYRFGTVLRVETVGLVTVQDRIGHGSELDLFMASRTACLRFGRQRLLVEVVRR